jgi:tetratricopeptide (TPR) repeat protein
MRDLHVHLPAAPPLTALPIPPLAASAVEVRWPTGDRTVSNLPPRNRVFTGRQALLTRLHRDLTRGKSAAVVQAQALHGLGGIGKTHLVLEYAYRHASDYELIWWVTADQPAAIPGQLVALASRLGLPEQVEQAETVAALLDELRHHDRWLLIFDNAEDPRDLHPSWPRGGGGHVLVTSRNPAWAGLAATVPVEALSRVEAIRFLRRRAHLDEQAADALAEALGDLPLALEQAAAYLEETGTPPDEYLMLLRKRAPELFALGRPPSSEQTIATTWSVSLDHVRTTTPVAQGLLSLCAFLGPDDLPRALLADHPEALPEPLGAAVRDGIAFQQALGALRRYSLVTVRDDSISVHRLVQIVVRHSFDPDGQQRWAATAVRLILAAFPDQAADVGAWPAAARLLPHALAATDHADATRSDPTAIAALLDKAGSYLWSRAEHAQAKALHKRRLAICEARLGPDHPGTAHSLNSLAAVLADQGDLDHARTLYERALTIYEASLGPDHSTTVLSLTNLGRVLRAQGDLDAARALHERALATCEARLGRDHSLTAQSLSNLAAVLHDQGDLDGARPLLERALLIREGHHGPNHPATAYCLSGLADVLHDQGDLEHARALHERALTIYEAHLGKDHPTTAHNLHNLATVLRDQGDLDGARTLVEHALTIREARLGPDHADTARSRERLAEVVAALENRQ